MFYSRLTSGCESLMREESSPADSIPHPTDGVRSAWLARLVAAFALFAILTGPSLAFGNWAQGFSTSRPSKLVQQIDAAVHGDRQARPQLLQLDRDRHVPAPGPLGPFALPHSLSIGLDVQKVERASFGDPVALASARHSIVAQPRAPPSSSLAA